MRPWPFRQRPPTTHADKFAAFDRPSRHYTQMLLILMSASIAVAVLQVFFLLADNQRAQAIMVHTHAAPQAP